MTAGGDKAETAWMPMVAAENGAALASATFALMEVLSRLRPFNPLPISELFDTLEDEDVAMEGDAKGASHED